MNFNQLRAIIKNIRTQITCPTCEGSYTTKDLSVVSSVANRCVLVAHCPRCNMPILITATLSNADQPARDNTIVTEQKQIQDIREEDLISSDDVLDMHQFLQSFSGDIRGAIKTRRQSNQD